MDANPLFRVTTGVAKAKDMPQTLGYLTSFKFLVLLILTLFLSLTSWGSLSPLQCLLLIFTGFASLGGSPKLTFSFHSSHIRSSVPTDRNINSMLMIPKWMFSTYSQLPFKSWLSYQYFRTAQLICSSSVYPLCCFQSR